MDVLLLVLGTFIQYFIIGAGLTSGFVAVKKIFKF